MNMDLGNGLGHLSYSTLVHAGDTWPEMRASLAEFVPRVKERVALDRRFGVSLRLSAAAAGELTARPEELAWLRRFLAERDLYLYTVNAFPYGPFKGGPVMERVYEPDWATGERVAYTCAVADLLAELAPDDVRPSIQTAPLAFAASVAGPDYVARFTTGLLTVVAHLAATEARTGRPRARGPGPAAGCRCPSSRSRPATWRPPTRPLPTSPSGSTAPPARPSSPGWRACRWPRRTACCAATSGSCSTSATRPSGSRT